MEIWLYLDSKGIKQQQWEVVWNECHEVLKCFPVPLAALDSEKKWGHERNIWKTQLINGENDETCLVIQCDMATLEFGGTFRLYRDLANYEASKKRQDILRIDEDENDEFYRYSDSFRIWENGTCGAPYSLAVLALGILLENRFPANCYMYGHQYSDEQVENMRAWLSGALNTYMRLPVCNDPAFLWERLLPLYPDVDLAVRRYLKLVKSSKRKSFEYLIAQGYGDALQNEVIHQISGYSSVSQWGVTDWLYPYLEATNDVEQVALLVKRVHEINGQEEFSLEELLENLVYKGITINPVKSEITKQWNDTGDSLVTGMEGLNRLFLRMGGLPDRIDFYISPDELLEIFGCLEPANGIKFQKLIEEVTLECLKKYQKMEDTTQKMTEKLSNEDVIEPSGVTEIMGRWTKHRNLPCEDYIIREVEGQVRTFSKSVESSLKIAQQLGDVLKDYEKKHGKPFFQIDTREEALEQIAFFSEKNKFALRETTWEIIDNEQDLDILTMLAIYAALNDNSKSFWEWKKHIFETSELWPAMRGEFIAAR